MAEREGFEPSEASSQLIEAEDVEDRCRNQSSLIASPKAGNRCRELDEIGSTWPKLSPQIRLAILTIIRSSGKEADS